jgi:hypothetical protein
VLVHRKSSIVLFARSRRSPASNFLAARIGAFEASLCYAKITPAALHRGEIGARSRKGAEAVGRKPESAIRDFEPMVAVRAAPAMSESAMAAS